MQQMSKLIFRYYHEGLAWMKMLKQFAYMALIYFYIH